MLTFLLVALGSVTSVQPTSMSQVANSLIPTRTAQAEPCQKLENFQEIPLQTLPKPFEQGCAIATPLRGNNPGIIVYVLKAGLKSPISTKGQDLSRQQIATLDQFVEQGQAARITWFRPGTLGSQKWVRSIPETLVFVAWDDLCTKFGSQGIGCIESGAFRPKALTEILVRNRERATVEAPKP